MLVGFNQMHLAFCYDANYSRLKQFIQNLFTAKYIVYSRPYANICWYIDSLIDLRRKICPIFCIVYHSGQNVVCGEHGQCATVATVQQ